MSSIFSHAPEPDYVSPAEATWQVISEVVGTDAVHAFDGFTDAVHLWWPVSEQSEFGEGSHVAFLRDNFVEEGEDGDELAWADIVEWESPTLLRLDWRVADAPLSSSEVEVRFEDVVDGACRISIGFEAMTAGDSHLVCDWPLILSRYARFMGGALRLD
ncbi:hypothetical protein [Arthrobacter sp. A2-55]|uniref:hypothetical protein n=1 Tax=Arthrobacter sp. A2-55 TaxID=2897337 RepID=UPI0021CD390E|nr:hypothetical protein [Arthrobacter sp. A2-55]MCU6482751.1 hypothetical protein [Arthrobacter sp. A2-55]